MDRDSGKQKVTIDFATCKHFQVYGMCNVCLYGLCSRVIMHNDLNRMWIELSVAYFNVNVYAFTWNDK
jgi:hypothetical protein